MPNYRTPQYERTPETAKYKRAACTLFSRQWVLDERHGIVHASKILLAFVPTPAWLTPHGSPMTWMPSGCGHTETLAYLSLHEATYVFAQFYSTHQLFLHPSQR